MSALQAIVYGLIQGLTEFLPVSSSAHLILLPFLTGWPDMGLGFDVALHWGTLLAVLIYFRFDIGRLFLDFLGLTQGQRRPENKLPLYIILGTIPGAALGFVFEKQAETLFRSPWILCVTLSLMGTGLFLADKFGTKNRSLADITWKTALTIGLAQGIAIVPGISRSGITITTALLLGLTRADAVRFSFYLAIPITAGAGLLKMDYLFHNANDPIIWLAMGTSLASGAAAIHILMTYVRTKSFTPFVVYRLILAGGVLTWLLAH